VDKLVRLAEIYAEDFDIGDLSLLPNQHRHFVNCARRTPDFLGCTELGKVVELMVKTGMSNYKLFIISFEDHVWFEDRWMSLPGVMSD
jgi:hypothetical protein